MNQHGQGVVRLAHVGGINLAGITGEHHFGSFADAGKDGLQGGGFEVLCLVNDYKLLLQGTSTQEGDRLKRQLSAIGEFVDQTASITT